MGLVRVLFAIIVGLSAFGYGWTLYQNQQADVQEAITVEGAVQSTAAEYTGSSGGANNPSGGHYEVVVRYSYTYDGQEYTSESVYPGAEKHHQTQESARAVANQYSAGQTTTVYVNQQDPSRAFLIEEETTKFPFALMGIGGLIAVVGLLGLGKRIVSDESGG